MIRKLMIGLAAAALVSTGPIATSAKLLRDDGGGARVPHRLVSTTKPAHAKDTGKNKVWGTFKMKTAKHKPKAYGASKGRPE